MQIMQQIHNLVWGPWTLVMLLGTGLWLSIKSGGFQVRHAAFWWKNTVGSLSAKDKGVAKVTPFQSACTALAATIGTGNIVGVATALTAGGAGALFWMWISAGIGMITAYAETSLGQQFRYRGSDGHWMCGPMIYMERGLSCPLLGILYAIFAMLASFGMGSMVQSNSMSAILREDAGIPLVVSGIVITALASVVILGGVGRIARVAERLVPVSAGIYLFFAVIVIFSCYRVLPEIFARIFQEAWSPVAAGGGVEGFLMSRGVRYGISRGVFSNEAGLGSLAVLHGAAEDTTPEQQGMWAMFEVFFDTIVICTLTALVILCVQSEVGVPAEADGAVLTAYCFSRKIGSSGKLLVSAAMLTFAFATIIGWYYLGEQTAEYLKKEIGEMLKRKGSRSVLLKLRRGDGRRRGNDLYTMFYLFAIFLGCISHLEFVWLLSDVWNGMMIYPNLLALWLLSRQIHFPHR